MNKEKLQKRLSHMKDFRVVPDEFYELIQCKRKVPKIYDMEKDARFKFGFKNVHYDNRRLNDFLGHISYSIVCNLSINCMKQPTVFQLLKMFQISEYTPDEVNEYFKQESIVEPKDIPTEHLRQSACLLMYALYKVFSDKSEWTTSSQKIINPSLGKLQRLVKYMKEENLLILQELSPTAGDTDSDIEGNTGSNTKSGVDKSDRINKTYKDIVGIYEDYVVKQADFLLKKQCVIYEMNEACELAKSRLNRIDHEIDKNINCFLKSTQKKNKSTKAATKTDVIVLPVKPINVDSIKNSTIHRTLSVFDPVVEVDDFVHNIANKLPTGYKNAEIDRLSQEADKIVTSLFALKKKTERLGNKIIEEGNKFVLLEHMSDIAIGAFLSILNGDDEMFKLNIGQNIWFCYMIRNPIPIPLSEFMYHNEIENWDSINTEKNGKLGLKIFSENDFITLVEDEDQEGSDEDNKREAKEYVVPLVSALSKISGKPLGTHLYVKKSHIQMFKDAGYSDRRARDFAVFLGAIALVDQTKRDDSGYLYDSSFMQGNAVASDNQKLEVGNISAVNDEKNKLQKTLKQMKKENQSYRHDISTLKKKNESLLQEIDHLKELLEENADIYSDSIVDSIESNDNECEITYPYRTNLKVVIYGGFETFHKSIAKLLPDVRIIDVSVHVDLTPFKKADIVFLQINKTDHSSYWSVCDACKGAGVTYLHLNYSSAKKCAEVMVNEIKKLENKIKR